MNRSYLVTAGPTREFIDDVRYLSNLSSGRMGYAIARAASRAGHRVVLVSGPTALPPPEGVEVAGVVSAAEMRDAVLQSAPGCGIIVMAAAVADYRPAARISGKMKKGPDTLELRLVRTPDILAELGAAKAGRFLVGFALEADDALVNARAKMAAKNCDMMVLNSPAAMAAERSEIHVLTPGGGVLTLGPAPKDDLAVELVRIIDEAAARQES